MSFSYFRKFALDYREVLPDTFQNFGGLCYNIQFKSCVTSKMVLFPTKK